MSESPTILRNGACIYQSRASRSKTRVLGSSRSSTLLQTRFEAGYGPGMLLNFHLLDWDIWSGLFLRQITIEPEHGT